MLTVSHVDGIIGEMGNECIWQLVVMIGIGIGIDIQCHWLVLELVGSIILTDPK